MSNITFRCQHCAKSCIAASANAIWYSAGHPNCSKECKRAEDEKLAADDNQAQSDLVHQAELEAEMEYAAEQAALESDVIQEQEARGRYEYEQGVNAT